MAKYIPGDPQRLLDKVWQMADERFAQGVPCKKGLKELLTALEDMGLPRIVAKLEPAHDDRDEFADHRHGAVFPRRCLRHGGQAQQARARHLFAGGGKAAPRPMQDCLVLEDSFNGIRAGRAAGCVTVMVPDLMQPTEEITQLYDRKCEDLLEVRDLLIEGKL